MSSDLMEMLAEYFEELGGKDARWKGMSILDKIIERVRAEERKTSEGRLAKFPLALDLLIQRRAEITAGVQNPGPRLLAAQARYDAEIEALTNGVDVCGTESYDAPDIEAIRQRRAAASPGPWRPGANQKYNVYIPYPEALEGPIIGERVVLRMNESFPYEADATFVGHAWEDIGRLLAMVDALGAKLATAEAQLHAIDNLPEDVWEDGEAARWIGQIREGTLDGLPTQEAYEARFLAEHRATRQRER